MDTRVHTVTFTAPQNANAFVTAYKIDWFDGATNVGTLDFKAAIPSVTFTNMVAAKVYAAKVTITLAPGAAVALPAHGTLAIAASSMKTTSGSAAGSLTIDVVVGPSATAIVVETWVLSWA